MATPADLLGQLAQQFEAAGQPQLANVFRGMAGPSGGGVPPTTSLHGNIRVVGSPPVGQLAGQLTSPMIGGQPASLFRSPLQLGPGPPVGPGSPYVGHVPARSSAGVQQVLGGQMGPFGRGRWQPQATAFPPPGTRGIPMPRRASSSLVQQAAARPTPLQKGLGDAFGRFAQQIGQQVPSRTVPAAAGGAGAGRPRIPTSAGFGAKGPFEMGPIGSTGPGRPMGNPQTVRAAAAALKVSPTGAKPGPAGTPTQAGRFAGQTDYAQSRLGLKNWARTFRNPAEIYRSAQAAAKTQGGRFASTLTGSRAVGSWRAANPAMAVAIVGNLVGVPRLYEEGSTGDQVAEGALIGASFGASFGGVGALVGAPVGMALNIITQGRAADFIQSLPVLGGFFGGTEKEKADITQHAADMFATAAKIQGVENPDEVAEAASKQFEVFNSMMESGVLDPSQAFQMVLTAGRMAGLTGFPWNPDELTPIYSAEDISAITRTVADELQPLHDVANGLMSQDFSHIADEETRARLIAVAQRAAGDIEEGFGASLRAPAQSAILAGAQRGQSSQALGSQLGGVGVDEFEAFLSGMG